MGVLTWYLSSVGGHDSQQGIVGSRLKIIYQLVLVQSNLFSLRHMHTFPLPHICIEPPPPLPSLKHNEGKMKLNLACYWVVLYMGNQPEKMSSHPRSWPDKTYFSPYTDLWPAFTWSPIAIRTWEFIQENILQVTLPLLKLASLREAG